MEEVINKLPALLDDLFQRTAPPTLSALTCLPLAFRPKSSYGDNLHILRQFRNLIRWPEMLTEKA